MRPPGTGRVPLRTPDAELAGALERLDRRGFLRLTGRVAAAGLVPTGCGAAPAELAPPRGLALQVLTPRTYATFQAAAHALLGPAGLAEAGAGGVDLAARADVRLASAPAFAGLVQPALLALEFGVHPLVPKWRPFTTLAPGERTDALAGLMTASWDLSRALFQGVRSFTWLAWYSAPESHAAIAYPGPFGRPGARVEDAMTYDLEP